MILKRHSPTAVRLLTVLLALILELIGCGRKVAPTLERPPPNMGQIVVLFMNYIGLHGGQSPGSADEFKRFIRTDGAPQAKQLGVDLARLEELFICPRDQQPYFINYGLRVGDNSKGLPIIAYEARGRDGNRTVAFVNGQIDEVDANRAAELGLKTG